MTEATPRVNAQMLESFMGRTVRILGKVTQLRGESATVDGGPGGQINVLLSRDSHLQLNHAFEIVGKVTSELNVRMLAATDFGTELDFNAVDAAVNATHRYKEIFYADD